MHVHKRGWRTYFVSAIALVAFALPLANLQPGSVQAQATFPNQGLYVAPSVTGAGSVSPAEAFNALGTNHTVAFTCTATATGTSLVTTTALGGLAGATATPLSGCFDTNASVQDASTGGATSIVGAQCNGAEVNGGVNSSTALCPFLAGTTSACPTVTISGTATSVFTLNPATSTCTAPIGAGNVFTTTAACTGAVPSFGPAPTANAAGTLCTVPAATSNQFLVKINPGAPDYYTITYQGYLAAQCPVGSTFLTTDVARLLTGATAASVAGCYPFVAATAAGACPAGVTGTVVGTGAAAICVTAVAPTGSPTCTVPGTGPSPVALTTFLGSLTTSEITSIFGLTAGASAGLIAALSGAPLFCAFEVQAAKKYVEITTITLSPAAGCSGSLIYAEGLKAFFGPACAVTASITGLTVLKNTACSQETSLVGTAAPAEFGAGAKYICENGLLAVQGVIVSGVPLTFNVTGPGSFNVLNSLNGFCSGVAGNTSFISVAGVPVTFCPTGPGAGTIQACLAPGVAGTSTGLPNNQPAVCSNTVPFKFTQTQARTVPYVRWAGEKIALTKCFGPGLGNQPVEFTLESPAPSLGATILPANLAGPIEASSNPAVPGLSSPSQNTIWAVTDANGCATVIGYAAGEGPMYVDASIYNANGIFGTLGVTAAACTVAGGTVGAATNTCTGVPATCPGITTTAGVPTFFGGGCVTAAFTTTPATPATACATGTFMPATPSVVVGTTTFVGFCTVPATCPADFTLSLPATTPPTCFAAISTATFNNTGPMVNEHAFEVFYLKFDHLDLENINPAQTFQTATALQPFLTSLTAAGVPFPTALNLATTFPTTFTLPSPPGANGQVAGTSVGGFNVPLCTRQYLRAMVHGYFEIPGDPSGRPAANVGIPNALTSTSAGAGGGTVSTGSYVLPAGRWVLPEDWPVLATFAGFGTQGAPADFEPSSVLAWDLNSGWVFNPGGENPVLCSGLGAGPGTFFAPAAGGTTGPLGPTGASTNPIDLGPCYGQAVNALTNGSVIYQTASGPGLPVTPGCAGGETVGIGPFDATQACTYNVGNPSSPFPLQYTPSGASLIGGVLGQGGCTGAGPCLVPAGPNSTYLPNGTLNQWDAPMPPAEVSFGITGGPGFLDQVNKTGLYALTFKLPAVCGSGSSLAGTSCVTGVGSVGCAAGCTSATAAPTCPSPYTFSASLATCANGTATLTPTCPSGYSFNSTLATCVSASASAVPTCPTGYSYNPANGDCELVVNPNPFYAEAIPASPLIPPITNNGGYLWNSWTFSAGTTTTVANASCFAGAAAGACVPGLSTTAPVTAAACTAIGALAGVAATTATVSAAGLCTLTGITAAARCPSFGTFSSAASTCTFATVPGGLQITALTCAGTGATATASVTVANGTGFVAGTGLTVLKYNAVTGAVVANNVAITAVAAAPTAAFPNAATLTISVPTAALTTALCGEVAFSGVIVQEQVGIPVANTGIFTVGGTVTISTTTGSVTVPIVAIQNGVIYVSSAAGIAAALGSGCFTAGSFAGCTFGTLIPAGSLIETGPKGSACTTTPSSTGATTATGGVGSPTTPGGLIVCAPPNPYPFWQWIPAPAASCGGCVKSATVYSDNHGEAVVSLDTGIGSVVSVAPNAAGQCPNANYAPVKSAAGTVTSCELINFAALGTASTPFANVAAALKQFSASNPGCIQTFPSGTTAAVGTSAINPATGPTSPVICVNSLGGIEFGTNAVLGATTVSAVAEYPYTRGEHPKIASPPLTKLWTSAWMKTVSVTPATTASVGGTTVPSYTVTITAQDVCGNPITAEPIEVFTLGGTGTANPAVLAPVTYGTLISSTNTSAVLTVLPSGTSVGTAGTATLSLEVLGGTTCLVLKVVFPLERIERFASVLPCPTTQSTLTVPYAPGWNMVGGPAASNFSTAEAVFAYNSSSGAYSDQSSTSSNVSSAGSSCAGYWAYFAAPMVVGLPATSKTGDKASCSLGAGWNLVGNSFGTPATLPSGVTGYHWNGTSYDTVTSIPAGGAVWVYNDGTLNSVTFTAT